MAGDQTVTWWLFEWEYGEPPDLSSWTEAVTNYTYASADLWQDNVFMTSQRGFRPF